jgi:hypothetical protein
MTTAIGRTSPTVARLLEGPGMGTTNDSFGEEVGGDGHGGNREPAKDCQSRADHRELLLL